jgi:hypothetical protein
VNCPGSGNRRPGPGGASFSPLSLVCLSVGWRRSRPVPPLQRARHSAVDGVAEATHAALARELAHAGGLGLTDLQLMTMMFLKLLIIIREIRVPGEGFEPPTFGLQNRCTATVLTRRNCREYLNITLLLASPTGMPVHLQLNSLAMRWDRFLSRGFSYVFGMSVPPYGQVTQLRHAAYRGHVALSGPSITIWRARRLHHRPSIFRTAKLRCDGPDVPREKSPAGRSQITRICSRVLAAERPVGPALSSRP